MKHYEFLILCAVPLTVLWPIYCMLTASRRPVGTLADWHRASVRIYWGVQRLYSARGLPSGRGGSHFHRHACHVLMRDLLANTLFIVNFLDNFAADKESRSSYVLRHPEITGRARNVLGQGTRLLLHIHWARLKLFCWPPAARAQRKQALAVAECYFCLCMTVTGLLKHVAS